MAAKQFETRLEQAQKDFKDKLEQNEKELAARQEQMQRENENSIREKETRIQVLIISPYWQLWISFWYRHVNSNCIGLSVSKCRCIV